MCTCKGTAGSNPALSAKDSERYNTVGQFGGQNELPTDDGASARLELTAVVETALARALMLAVENKRWDVVEKIAAELHTRRNRTTRRQTRPPRAPRFVR